MTDEKDSDPLEYDEFQTLLKNNLGTIIRDVENREERIRFSKSDWPDIHSTLIEAAVWYTTETNSPKYTAFVLRSLESSSGRSAIADGNKYFETYSDAVEWIESLAEEYDGEPLNWRDLPKKPISGDCEDFVCLRDDG